MGCNEAIHTHPNGGYPITIDQSEVESYLKQINGVINVHDLHIWTITSGLDSLSCHLLVEEHADTQEILQRAIDLIKDKFQIEHTTIQIETKSLNHSDLKI